MRRFRPRFWPSFATLVALVILCGLGTWQVERLAWKTDLIQLLTERVNAPPLPVDQVMAMGDRGAWRPVSATGRLLEIPRHRLFVEARDGLIGSRVLGVLETPDGRSFLVDRGWAPDNEEAPPVTAAQVELRAILRDRSAEHRTMFVPENEPAKGRWYWVDMPSISSALGRELEPWELQLLPGSPGATAGVEAPRIDLPNNHLGYAITWYGLAIGLLGVYLAFSFERTESTP